MVKKEKLTFVDAFEIYYQMGADRSLSKLHRGLSNSALTGEFDKVVPSLRTFKEWSRKHNWQNRCLLKDLAVADISEKKTIRAALDFKAKCLSLVERRIETITDKEGKLLLPIAEYKDFHEAVRLGLSLMGEPEPHEVQHSIKIIRVQPNERDD